MNEALKEMMNLDNWTETVTYSCIDGLICPHCKGKYPLNVAKGLKLDTGSKAVLSCVMCGKRFQVQLQESPLGEAWVTAIPNP